MKDKSLILIFLSIFSIVYANNFSQNLLCEKSFDESFMCELLSEFPSSIDRCTEDKIYIKPGHIKSTSLGMVLNENEKILHLPVVFSDHYGAYIHLDENVKPVSGTHCIGCGWARFSGDPCGNPKCKFNRNRWTRSSLPRRLIRFLYTSSRSLGRFYLNKP